MKYLLIVLVLCGCASPKDMRHYYTGIKATNRAIVDSIKEQTNNIQAARVSQMAAFTAAMQSAAKTKEKTDDVIISFAWGYQLASPARVEIPKLQYPKHPVTDIDRVTAWLPVIGMAIPLLQPLFYGNWGDGDRDTAVTYTTTGENAFINVDSNNPGSHSSSGGDMTTSVDKSINSAIGIVTCGEGEGEESCADLGPIVIPGGPSIGGVPSSSTGLQDCIETPSSGYGANGQPMWSPDCSCVSYYQGMCGGHTIQPVN